MSIGPAIGGCCYEVDKPVFDALKQSCQGGLAEARNVDLREINRRQLIAAGVDEEQLEVVGGCTACHAEDYFSFRRDRGMTGRMMAFIGRP